MMRETQEAENEDTSINKVARAIVLATAILLGAVTGFVGWQIYSAVIVVESTPDAGHHDVEREDTIETETRVEEPERDEPTVETPERDQITIDVRRA